MVDDYTWSASRRPLWVKSRHHNWPRTTFGATAPAAWRCSPRSGLSSTRSETVIVASPGPA